MRHKAIWILKHQVLRSNKLIKIVYDVKTVNLFLFYQYIPLLFIFQQFFHDKCLKLMGFHSKRKTVISPFVLHIPLGMLLYVEEEKKKENPIL